MKRLVFIIICSGAFFQTQAQNQGMVPDSVELAVLKDFYISLNGPNWTNNSNWPDINNWPDSAIDINLWHGIKFANGDIKEIVFWQNNLSGELPSSLGLLTEIERLNIEDNSVTGLIPPEIGNLLKLKRLELTNNQITGKIPGTIGDILALERLSLGGNMLGDSIPPELGNLENLIGLDLGRNILLGGIPEELGNLTNLVSLNLRSNNLGGPLPQSIGNLKNLKTLMLIKCNLQGHIPDYIGGLTSLVNLFLHNNNLYGEIPETICGLDSLKYLQIPLNKLEGEIPSCMGEMNNLITVSLENNLLSGLIPVTFTNLANLHVLQLNNNININGDLPNFISPYLTSIYISKTSISGIPDLTQHPNKSNLKLYMDEASLPPGEIEKNLISANHHEFLEFTYANQKYSGPVDFDFTTEESLLLPAVNGGINGVYSWKKKDLSNGHWQQITSANEDIEGDQYYKSNFSLADTGIYRFTITNLMITGTYTSLPLNVTAYEGMDLFAVNSGNWHNPQIWSYSEMGSSINRVPRSADRIFIKDQIIQIQNDVICSELYLQHGNSSASILLEVGKMIVLDHIEIDPSCSGCEIELTGSSTIKIGYE